MTPARRFGLLYLSSPLLAALPCVHTRMDDVTGSYSPFALFASSSSVPLSTSALAPYLFLVLASGVGASLAFRRVNPDRARPLALGVAVTGLLAVLTFGLPVFAGHEQKLLFLPSIHFSAGVGLWGLLGLQILALRTAWKFPVETPEGR